MLKLINRQKFRKAYTNKLLNYQFTETDLGLSLKVQLEAIDYWFGLYYVPGECSSHWDVENFEKI